MHQVKVGDKFKLLGMEWEVKQLVRCGFHSVSNETYGLVLPLDKTDLLEWVEPEESSDGFVWTVQATKDFKSEIKREILEEIAEAWEDWQARGELGVGFGVRLRNRAKGL